MFRHGLRAAKMAIALFCFALLPSAAPGKAPAPVPRLALVIGNGDYAGMPGLPNGPRDATLVGAALGEAGFKVLEATDFSRARLEARIAEFRQLSANAGPGAVSVIYYAGHGFSIGDQSLLLAIDSRIEGARVDGAVPLTTLLGAASANPRGSGVVIVDACRKLIEFQDLGLSPGALAPRGQPGNTFVVFSTSRGYAAADGEDGGHSPFALTVVEQLKKAGQPIGQFFDAVREGVLALTAHGQQPEIFPALNAAIVLNDRPVSLSRSLQYKAYEAFQNGDKTGSAALLRRAAALGDPKAMISYADRLYYGQGVAPDIETAIFWYHKAAQAGDSEGWHALGQVHEFHPEMKDRTSAVSWLEEGIKAGNKESMFSLAVMLQDDRLGIKNVPRAIELYGKSLEAYNCCSAVNLARLYALGQEVPRDLPKASRYAQLAADRGNVKGFDILGYIAVQEKDYTKAVRIYEVAASRGSAHAWLQLGVFSANGTGLDRNRQRAAVYFRKGLARAEESKDEEMARRAREYLDLLDE